MQSLQSRNRGKKRSKTALIVILALLLVAAAGTGGLYALKLGPFAPTETGTNKNSSEKETKTPDTGSDDDVSEPPVAEPSDPTSDSVKNSPPGSDSDQASNNDQKLTITSTGVNGDNFSIRTLISDVTQSGTCNLTMNSESGKTYTASAGVQAVASSSTCKGFDIPLSSLGSGNWKIDITYINGGTKASTSKEVVINA